MSKNLTKDELKLYAVQLLRGLGVADDKIFENYKVHTLVGSVYVDVVGEVICTDQYTYYNKKIGVIIGTIPKKKLFYLRNLGSSLSRLFYIPDKGIALEMVLNFSRGIMKLKGLETFEFATKKKVTRKKTGPRKKRGWTGMIKDFIR